MSRDELSMLKDYVRSLEGQNESKNRERASLQRQLDDLLIEVNQFRAARSPQEAHLTIERSTTVVHADRSSTADGKQFASDIAILKHELDSLQQEIGRAKQEFRSKESSWETQRQSLVAENQQLKAAVSGNDVRSDFDKLRVAYSLLQIELNNRINQLQATNRTLQSEKNRLQIERDNHKQERQRLTVRVSQLERQVNNRLASTPYMPPDNSERIAQLNSIINDLNNQLQQVTRERDFQRASRPESERVAELTSLIEELNSSRTKLRTEFDTVRAGYEKEKVGLIQEINRLRTQLLQVATVRVPPSPTKDNNEWLKEKSQLLLEISNLKNEKNSVGKVADGHTRRLDELQRENNQLRGQTQITEQQLTEYRRKEEIVRREVQQISTELSRLAEMKKHVDAELLRSKNEIANLTTSNSVLQNELVMLRQASNHEQALAGETARLHEVIKELERRVYVLESANYNLSEELNRNLQHSKSTAGFEQIMQALKAELLEKEVENQKLVQINQDLMIDYRECTDKLKQERDLRERELRERTRSVRQLSPHNTENQQQYSRLEFVQQPPSPSRSQGVFEQRWEDNDPRRGQHKLYCAHPAPDLVTADTSKWTALQRKINALKHENQELKRSLHLPH